LATGCPVAALVTVPVTEPAWSSRIVGAVTLCPAATVSWTACALMPVPPLAPTHWSPYPLVPNTNST
jgi:hypothetical protein